MRVMVLVGVGVTVGVGVFVGVGVCVGGTITALVGAGGLLGAGLQGGSPGSPQVGEVGVGVHSAPVNGSTQVWVCAAAGEAVRICTMMTAAAMRTNRLPADNMEIIFLFPMLITSLIFGKL